MTPNDGRAGTSPLDEWVASVGEEAVAAAAEEARCRIAEGSIPGFTDKEQFLEYLQRPHRRSA